MRLSARGAQKTRNESKKLQMYSKQWAPGDTLRVFYPIYWENGKPEIAVGAIWGHSVSDIKGLGLKTAFIPSTTEFNENGDPIGNPDITYQFSLIAGIFVQGQKAIEEANIMKKNWPSEAARREALTTLDNKYDTKNNMQAVKPIISRAQYYISTEALSVKLVNGIPDKETVCISSAPLSNQTIDKLYAIMDDPKYAPMEGDEFLEVEWKYPVNTEKSMSAKAATVSGLTPEYRLSTTAPTEWGIIQGVLPGLASDSISITRRATRSVDPVRVRQALTQYAFMNSEYLDVATEESTETLCKHADLIHELDVCRALTNTELQNKIQEAIAKIEAMPTVPMANVDTPAVTEMTQQPDGSMANTPVGVPEVPTPATVPGTNPLPDLSNITGAPSVQDLMNNTNNLSADGALDMESVDLSSI